MILRKRSQYRPKGLPGLMGRTEISRAGTGKAIELVMEETRRGRPGRIRVKCELTKGSTGNSI